MGDCFICVGEASDRYTLLFDSDSVLTDQWMCSSCYSDFTQVEWLEIRETPVLTRGGDGDDEDGSETTR